MFQVVAVEDVYKIQKLLNSIKNHTKLYGFYMVFVETVFDNFIVILKKDW